MPSITDEELTAHRTFLDGFGGDAALAAQLSLRRQTVYQWRQRGVAWHWRPRLAAMAEAENIPVPGCFLAYDK